MMIHANGIVKSLLAPLSVAVALALPQIVLADSSTPASSSAEQLGAPSMAQIVLVSHEARMNGLVYRAAGEGPHPVALFLHGFPGNEKNLDLVRRLNTDCTQHQSSPAR